MTETPSMFSAGNPKLQRAWDATSFRALMTCPRYYQYSILEGWRGHGMIDLEFGGLFAASVETFKRARLDGKSRDDAQLEAVRYAIDNSGQHTDEKWTPWGGEYRTQWRCTGTEPYKNAKGNKAKCPLSHKGVWQEGDAPSVCGNCGSPTDSVDRWIPNSPNKDRYALVRAVAWYAEEQPEDPAAGVSAIRLPNGQPAVELPFRIPLPFQTPFGEPYILAGYFDSVVKFGTEHFIADDKTTKKMLNGAYWQGFSPHIQMDIYDLAGSIALPDLNLKGVLIEGTQLLVNGARFGKHQLYHKEANREELLKELEHYLHLAEYYAENDYWPMNRASCAICPFKKICSMHPASRDKYLQENFERRQWNPLEER